MTGTEVTEHTLVLAEAGLCKCCSIVAGRLQVEVGKEYSYMPYRNVRLENVE
jgi:hypothetical protein